MDKTIQTTDPAIVSKIASNVTLAASGGTIWFGLTANELAALGGLVIALLGLIVNTYFRYKTYKLAKKKSEE